MAAGSKLKTLRNRCNITVRQVEQASRRIALAKGDKRFRISNGWLAQLENGISEPSICKLFTLSVIYQADFRELSRLYNVDLDEIAKYALIANPDLTQLSTESSIGDVADSKLVRSRARASVIHSPRGQPAATCKGRAVAGSCQVTLG